MSGPRLRLAALAVVALLQLAVPAQMIVARERTLREGTAWRFRTAPVDPADAFRGNYLALRFEAESAPVPTGLAVDRGERVVVPLLRDAAGFAQLGPVRREPPASGDWLRLRVGWVEKDAPGTGTMAHVELPFDRFYLDEGLAPRADAKFAALGARRGDLPAQLPAWAVVRVRAGRAVLEDVLIDGRSVRGGD